MTVNNKSNPSIDNESKLPLTSENLAKMNGRKKNEKPGVLYVKGNEIFITLKKSPDSFFVKLANSLTYFSSKYSKRQIANTLKNPKNQFLNNLIAKNPNDYKDIKEMLINTINNFKTTNKKLYKCSKKTFEAAKSALHTSTIPQTINPQTFPNTFPYSTPSSSRSTSPTPSSHSSRSSTPPPLDEDTIFLNYPSLPGNSTPPPPVLNTYDYSKAPLGLEKLIEKLKTLEIESKGNNFTLSVNANVALGMEEQRLNRNHMGTKSANEQDEIQNQITYVQSLRSYFEKLRHQD